MTDACTLYFIFKKHIIILLVPVKWIICFLKDTVFTHQAFKRRKDFAFSNSKSAYLSANPFHVAVYLQNVLESTKSCSSFDTAFYAIKWAHEIASMASPTDNQTVSRVRKAAKRILGAGRPSRKELLTRWCLKDIVEGADLSNILQLRNLCL